MDGFGDRAIKEATILARVCNFIEGAIMPKNCQSSTKLSVLRVSTVAQSPDKFGVQCRNPAQRRETDVAKTNRAAAAHAIVFELCSSKNAVGSDF